MNTIYIIERVLEIIVAISGSASVINVILTSFHLNKAQDDRIVTIVKFIRLLALDTLTYFKDDDV